jgi:alkylation response protein AidB-like acyl-CoA dehydrogenase
MAVGVHCDMASPHLYWTGSEALKEKYLPAICRGETLTAVAVTEPGGGSDVAAIRTRAVRDGDHYVINGSKMFITNGTIADYCLVAAYTDPSRRGAGISLFIVDTDKAGFTVERKLRKTGHHTSETAALAFDEMRVPASALLGGVEGGFQQVTGSLEGGRVAHAARSVGVSQAALEAAVAYAKERRQFGQPIAKFQAIKFKLARMAMEVDVARTTTLRAAWMFDQGPCMREAAMAKLFCSEVAQRVTWEAMQIFGGYGYITEFPVERYWRDARLMTITEGTSEIQLIIIARELGL